MSEELKQEAAAGDGDSASEEARAPGAAPEAGAVSGDATLEGLSPEVQATVKAQVQAAVKAAEEAQREKYEGTDGDIAKVKSQRDKLKHRLAAVERTEREQALAQHQAAVSLQESDPERAAAMALEQNQSLLAQQQQAGQQEQVSDWVLGIMRDMGYDLDDGANITVAEAKTQKIMSGLPDSANYTYEVQQELARDLAAAKGDEVTALQKELVAQKENIAALVKDEVTRAIAGTNSPDGAAPGAGSTQEAWREKPSGQKRRDGLAKRRANPVRRVVKS